MPAPLVLPAPRRVHRWTSRVLAACLAIAAPCLARAEALDLSGFDQDMTSPPTRMLTLGSVHLGQLEEFDPAALEPLLDRLAAFAPQVITIEAHAGAECDFASRHPTLYEADYCASNEAAMQATGLDIPTALARIETTLAHWPQTPGATDRRRLASLFLAANDRASAYVQWLRLDPLERRPGDGLDTALVELLEQTASRNNENYRIGARLAARLGLERVHAVDDHTGDRYRRPDRQAFGTALSAAWDTDRAGLDALIAREEMLARGDDLLPLYRALNHPDTQRILADANVGRTLRAASPPPHHARMWVGGWELRNLRMVGNVLDAVRERPGVRVLNIVGNSHKAWYDSWLGRMSGVEIVDALEVLQ
ncbi:DUF5694 domain-containing protein [Xanthomonas sp. XNM01]|uniref:DUF5694 domain-containing protein n=1 Tax=Xanthomonas sp. XNM01 TaxID=2769289 RepID=UPI001CE1C154|nr:DUF5694 domain-containing protein [Xanthomonas sp. XNM01]